MSIDPLGFAEIYNKAVDAGNAAATACDPVPMIVGSPTTPLGHDIDTTKRQYFVEGGVCGFAWVNIRPGNSKFANWARRRDHGRTDSYYGGLTIWVDGFGQSMQRKEAYARAFAAVLCDNGVNARANSRMD